MLFLLTLLLAAVGQAKFSEPALDRQCWHERVLQQVDFNCARDENIEYAVQQQVPFGQPGPDYAPWSYAPVCTQSLEGVGDKLCVYTSTSFGHGRGISIFTTPGLAAQFVLLPAFQDLSRLDAENVNANSRAWRAEPIPNKGIGMLASRSLKFKDRITAYTPALIAHLEYDLGTAEREMWWRYAIEQLPEKIKKEFLELTFVFGDERVRVQDIVKANTFQVEIAGVNHLAVFPETSRLNHACNPNAQYIIDTELLTHFVHATRPIAKGEEITISYTSPLDPISERHAHLQSGFHFTCTCPRCVDQTSDSTLTRIQTLQSQLNDWSANSVAAPRLAEQLMQIYRDEGLEGFMDVAYGFAALAYSAVGNKKKALEFASRAKEAILMKDGRWAPNLQIWEEILGSVERHWSWRRRM